MKLHITVCFPVIKTNRISYGKLWFIFGIQISCKHKRELYTECRKYKNPTLDKYYKDYCQILSKVIKEAKNKWNIIGVF